MEGTFWETYEYRLNFAFENNQYSTVGLDEFWIGDNKLPVIGTVRVGHVKTPMGLEGDMNGSSRSHDLHGTVVLFRSHRTEPELRHRHLVQQHVPRRSLLWQAYGVSSRQWQPAAISSGPAQWGVQARITGLPLYEDEGRHLLHLGISGGWRNGTTASPAWRPIRCSCGPGPNCATTIRPRRPSSPCRTPMTTGWSIRASHHLQPGIPAGHRIVVYPRTFLVASRVRMELPEQRPGHHSGR